VDDKWLAPAVDEIVLGTQLSRAQHRVDIDEWGDEDARITPQGAMTPEQIAAWTCRNR
jgi:hypothetical protein